MTPSDNTCYCFEVSSCKFRVVKKYDETYREVTGLLLARPENGCYEVIAGWNRWGRHDGMGRNSGERINFGPKNITMVDLNML